MQTNVAMTTGVVEADLKYKVAIRKLGITQVALSSANIVIGVVLVIWLPIFTVAEGAWCGIWGLTAGVLGILAGGGRSTVCLVNAHLSFCIIGAVFSGILFSMEIPRSLIFIGGMKILLILQTVIAVANFIILIVGASCCCATRGNCCAGCCGNCCGAQTQPQVVYVPDAPQQPLVVQGGGVTQVQGYQPVPQIVVPMQQQQ